jgi:hypothetical protein
VGVGGLPPQEVNATFSDILQHFDLGFTGAAEARKGRFSVAADLVWEKISAESGTPLGIIADKVELTTDMVMATGVAGYSLISSEEANLDVIAGARLWSITNDLEIKGGKIGSASADDNQTWIDPVVGFKGRANLTPDIYVMGWGLVGGFGVSSKFMWDAMAGVGYDFNKNFSMTVGYRGVGDDYRNNGFVYDIVQSGPIVGFYFNF